MNLSEAARTALVNARGTTVGAMVNCDTRTYRELLDADIIGPSFGLTRKGSAAAMRAKREAEDKAFG